MQKEDLQQQQRFLDGGKTLAECNISDGCTMLLECETRDVYVSTEMIGQDA